MITRKSEGQRQRRLRAAALEPGVRYLVRNTETGQRFTVVFHENPRTLDLDADVLAYIDGLRLRVADAESIVAMREDEP